MLSPANFRKPSGLDEPKAEPKPVKVEKSQTRIGVEGSEPQDPKTGVGKRRARNDTPHLMRDFIAFEEFGAGRIAKSLKAAEGRTHSKTLARVINP